MRAGALRAAAFFGRDFLAGRALRAVFRRAELLEAFMRDALRAAFFRRGALRFAFFFATVSPPL